MERIRDRIGDSFTGGEAISEDLARRATGILSDVAGALRDHPDQQRLTDSFCADAPVEQIVLAAAAGRVAASDEDARIAAGASRTVVDAVLAPRIGETLSRSLVAAMAMRPDIFRRDGYVHEEEEIEYVAGLIAGSYSWPDGGARAADRLRRARRGASFDRWAGELRSGSCDCVHCLMSEPKESHSLNSWRADRELPTPAHWIRWWFFGLADEEPTPARRPHCRFWSDRAHGLRPAGTVTSLVDTRGDDLGLQDGGPEPAGPREVVPAQRRRRAVPAELARRAAVWGCPDHDNSLSAAQSILLVEDDNCAWSLPFDVEDRHAPGGSDECYGCAAYGETPDRDCVHEDHFETVVPGEVSAPWHLDPRVGGGVGIVLRALDWAMDHNIQRARVPGIADVAAKGGEEVDPRERRAQVRLESYLLAERSSVDIEPLRALARLTGSVATPADDAVLEEALVGLGRSLAETLTDEGTIQALRTRANSDLVGDAGTTVLEALADLLEAVVNGETAAVEDALEQIVDGAKQLRGARVRAIRAARPDIRDAVLAGAVAWSRSKDVPHVDGAALASAWAAFTRGLMGG